MAGKVVAKTSPDMERCTLHWEEYPVAFDGYTYKVFDTVGLEEHQLGMKDYLDAIVNAYNLIAKLQNEGGIHLLLFCIRAGRFHATIQNNYRLFYELLCEKKVPIVLVVTGLETQHRMEDWWDKCKSTLDKNGIVVSDHACITAASGLVGRNQALYQESRQLVRDIVTRHTRNGQEAVWKGDVGWREGDGWKGGDGWFHRFIFKLKELLLGKDTAKQREIVTALTRRCGMPREAAVHLARQIRTKLLLSY